MSLFHGSEEPKEFKGKLKLMEWNSESLLNVMSLSKGAMIAPSFRICSELSSVKTAMLRIIRQTYFIRLSSAMWNATLSGWRES